MTGSMREAHASAPQFILVMLALPVATRDYDMLGETAQQSPGQTIRAPLDKQVG